MGSIDTFDLHEGTATRTRVDDLSTNQGIYLLPVRRGEYRPPPIRCRESLATFYRRSDRPTTIAEKGAAQKEEAIWKRAKGDGS